MVICQLLLQEAKAKNMLEDVEQIDNVLAKETIDTLIQQEVVVPQAGNKSCKRYYKQNKDRFIDKSTDKVLPFDSVHVHIQNYLHAWSLQTSINQYITLLTGSANIAGFDLEDM
jgi:hypothetical protein